MRDVAIFLSTDCAYDMNMLRQPKWVKIVAICFLGGLVFFLILEFNSHFWLRANRLYEILHSRQQLKGIIRSFGAYSPLAYMLLQFIQVVIAPIPGGAIEFLGGYFFGAKAGFLYSMVGLFFGSWFAFGLARIFEKVAVEKFVRLRRERNSTTLLATKASS